jgi:predicted phage tail protein
VIASGLTPSLTRVQLYGPLRQRFGKVHHYDVRSPHEAVKALCATKPGFAEFLLCENALHYRVIVGNESRDLAGLTQPVASHQVIKIVPVYGGNKSGLKMILTGLLLFYAAPFAAGMMSSTALGGTLASYGMKIGSALMLGGLMQLVSPQRKQGVEPRVDNQPSYAFSGAVNTTQQGYPVPLVFGRVITGGATISGGMSADELVASASPSPAPGPQTLPAEQPRDPIVERDIP